MNFIIITPWLSINKSEDFSSSRNIPIIFFTGVHRGVHEHERQENAPTVFGTFLYSLSGQRLDQLNGPLEGQRGWVGLKPYKPARFRRVVDLRGLLGVRCLRRGRLPPADVAG